VVQKALTDAAKSRMLYHVEAGITLQELYNRLDTEHGWAFPTWVEAGDRHLLEPFLPPPMVRL